MGCCAYFYPEAGELPVEDEFAFHGTYTTYWKALDAMGYTFARDELADHSSVTLDPEAEGCDLYVAVISALAKGLREQGPANVRAAHETILSAALAQKRAGYGRVVII